MSEETKTGRHVSAGLTEHDHCCGENFLICGACGHKGMDTVEVEPGLGRDIIKCPACGHESNVRFDTPRGTIV